MGVTGFTSLSSSMRCLFTTLTMLFLTLYVESILGKPRLALIETKDNAKDYKDYKDYNKDYKDYNKDYKDYNKDYKDYSKVFKGKRGPISGKISGKRDGSADYFGGRCVCVRSPCPCDRW